MNSVTCMKQLSKIWCETMRLKGCRGSPRHTVALAVSLSKGTPEQICAWLLCNIRATHSTSCVSHSLLHRLRWKALGRGPWPFSSSSKEETEHATSGLCQHVLPFTTQIHTVSHLKGYSVSVITEHLQGGTRQPQPHSFLWDLKLGPGFPCLL